MTRQKVTGHGPKPIIKHALLLITLLAVSLWPVPVIAEGDFESCIPCHGPLEDVHSDLDHNAEPGSGIVAIFADTDHDDAGWVGDKPYFGVDVDCGGCHNSDLPIVHGNDCATCHPTPYDTLGTWNKSCRQSDCHPAIHQEVIPSHYPWVNAYNPSENDCSICHSGGTWWPTLNNCLNCHAAAVDSNTSPPTTSAKNVPAEFIGPARIDFSVTDNGKVGVGRTFYRLNGGPVTAAGKYAFIDDENPGPQELEFWSIDQNGNEELAHNFITFDIVQDTEPPHTTSDAKASYSNGGLITLKATDNSDIGVRKTYYRLTPAGQEPGAAVTGKIINLPTIQGTVDYTLEYWSVDWAGNQEPHKATSFSVTSGNGTIRLVWWDCDVNPSHCPTSSDGMAWSIRLDNSNGSVVSSGSAYGSGWSGVNNIPVQIRSAPYYVRVDWVYQEDIATGTETGLVYVTTSGQLVRFNY